MCAQPGQPPSLSRVFAVRMKKAWVLSYPLSAQRILWSDWDAQADLSLRWAHNHFVVSWGASNEPSHEITVLYVLCKLILQTHMRRHPVGLDVWFFAGNFVSFHTSCVRRAKALVRLRGCTGSPEPSLVAYEISTIISWAGLNIWIVYRNSRNKWTNLEGEPHSNIAVLLWHQYEV